MTLPKLAGPLSRTRFADHSDAPAILKLITDAMAKSFRVSTVPDLIYLIDFCVYSICLLNVDETIVGFLAAKDYPQIPSVAPNAWEEYVWTKYKAVDMNARNTIFLHMLCWEPAYAREAVDRMLKALFMQDPHLQHICMIKTVVAYPLLVPGQSRAEASFRRVSAVEKGTHADLMPVLCVADRVEVSPRLRIRKAVEEDNDDIVPILELQTSRLQEMYGEFYISELISCHPESDRVLLVCEHKEVAVGVMSLNTVVNYEALENAYELSPFAGLKKLTSKPVLESERAGWKDIGSYNNLSTIFEMGQAIDKTVNKSSWSGISDEEATRMDREFEDNYYARLDYLNLLEDEDDMEYDIVNIDTELLRVPECLYAIPQGEKNATRTAFDSISAGEDARITCQTYNKTKKTLAEFPNSAQNLFCATPRTQVRYEGTPNAFVLELFAMHPDYDYRYGFDMLEVAFELFPGMDYCIMCLPSNHPPFPLLEHFTYVTPYGYNTKLVNESLYVAHVNAIRGELSVRPAEAYDLPKIADIIEHSPRRHSLMKSYENSLYSPRLNSFVMMSENLAVGLVILEPLEQGAAVRVKYDLNPEPYRAGTDGVVTVGVVSPVFESHIRWLIRELLRFTRYTNLFWKCRMVARGDANPCRHLMSLAGHMLPVRPRRFNVALAGNKILEQILQDPSPPFSLWYVDRPLTGMPIAQVNNSIVVVGASRTGLAFIETLIVGPSSNHLIFNNITLVSEHGLGTSAEPFRAADICVPREGRFTNNYIKSMPFYFYVDVISNVVIKIDRKQKCITMRGGGIKYYDTLVLTCGLQFQHPDYLKEALQRNKELRKGKPCERILMDDPLYRPDQVLYPSDLPGNVFLTNSSYQANMNLRKLLTMISDAKETRKCLSPTNRVVVYGECLDAYTCISALMELGLQSDLLSFVEPFPPDDERALRVNCFNNEEVDERVQMQLHRLGIATYRHCHLMGWRLNEHGNAITGRFMTRLHAFQLPTFALFYYGKKAIDINSFKAINESGLVYDGGLVVGPNFETNDPSIYAAGTCTKYSRRLYADKLAHPSYSCEKIAEALAKSVLADLDPFIVGNPHYQGDTTLIKFTASTLGISRTPSLNFEKEKERTQRHHINKWEPVPIYLNYIMQYGLLPGGLHYMKIRSPGPEIPMEVQLSLPHQGHILKTNMNGNLFRLQLNELHEIVAITCLSNKPFNLDIIMQLYGRHESFFNNLLPRFQLGRIDDLFEYFENPQHTVLYQETFGDLINDINMQDVGTIYDLAKSRFRLPDEPTTSVQSLLSSARSVPSFQASREGKTLGTFRSILDHYAHGHTVTTINELGFDIPSECGQSERIRDEAREFWTAVGGERIVIAYLTRYLHKYAITCPQYLQPK